MGFDSRSSNRLNETIEFLDRECSCMSNECLLCSLRKDLCHTKILVIDMEERYDVARKYMRDYVQKG